MRAAGCLSTPLHSCSRVRMWRVAPRTQPQPGAPAGQEPGLLACERRFAPRIDPRAARRSGGRLVRWPTRRDQLLAGGDKGGGASSDRNGVPHYPRTSPHRPQVSPRSATCLACEHGRRRPRSRSGQWRRRALRLVDARRDAAAEHAAARERIRASESLKARQLVEHFGREGVARGSRRTPLRARAYNGTPPMAPAPRLVPQAQRLAGRRWRRQLLRHVDRDKLPGPDHEGGRRTHRPTSDDRLMIGVGARDGESMSLEELLRIRLDARDDWPVAT